MNILSTICATDSSGMIGALELGDALGIDDGALERAARIDAGPSYGCTRWGGPCITDGALEAACGATAGQTGQLRRPNTACI